MILLVNDKLPKLNLLKPCGVHNRPSGYRYPGISHIIQAIYSVDSFPVWPSCFVYPIHYTKTKNVNFRQSFIIV